jgi:hypothetical protein
MGKHPITPPPELVKMWANDSPIEFSDETWAYELFIAHNAARWGADMELEALALIDDCTDPEGDYLDDNALSIIRRALEALPND